MDYPKIKRLCKYAPFNSRSISALVTGKLWYARPHSFNDPFDCTLPNHSLVHLEQRQFASAKEHRAATRNRSEKESFLNVGDGIRAIHQRSLSRVSEGEPDTAKAFVNGHNTLQSFLHTFGVLSLSATPRSILMWSHYGAQHSGICFEFNRSPTDKLGTDAKPVIYSNQREADRALVKQSHVTTQFLKYSGWSYEREWRQLENDGGRLYDFPGMLLSVICGARMPSHEVDVVTRVVTSPNSSQGCTIAVKAAEMAHTTYRISIRPHQSGRSIDSPPQTYPQES